MTYHADDEDNDDSVASDGEDPELPDPSDRDDPGDDDSTTVECPYCRESIYDGAERCPHCGHYLSDEDAPRRRSGWLVVGVIVCLIIVLVAWLG